MGIFGVTIWAMDYLPSPPDPPGRDRPGRLSCDGHLGFASI